MLLLVYFFVSTIGSFLKNNSLIYYCNYVLGTYNDGITKTLLSVIGGPSRGNATITSVTVPPYIG